MNTNYKTKVLLSNLYKLKNKFVTIHSVIDKRYITPSEGYYLLRKDNYNVFLFNDEICMLLSTCENRIKKFKLQTISHLDTITCEICVHKQCNQCHYQAKTEGQVYMILDDIMVLCKVMSSAYKRNYTDIYLFLGDKIIEIIKNIDLPIPDESKSRFKGQIYKAYLKYMTDMIGFYWKD